MKKIIVLSLFSFFLLSGISFADVIPDNSHKVDKCVKITNLDQFIYNGLIGSVIFGDSVKNYIIENNKCLTSGYKFATLKIYSYNKEGIVSVDLENLNNIDTLKLLTDDIDLNDYYVDNFNPAIKETVKYSLVWLDNELSLKKDNVVFEYNNTEESKSGLENSQESSESSESSDNSEMEKDQNEKEVVNNTSTRKNFWRSLLCFFGFSKYC